MSADKKTPENQKRNLFVVGSGGGPGRPPGKPNKTTATVKQMLLGALDELGGQRWLMEQAKAEPKAFMSLLSRLIPTETKTEVTTHELTPEERTARIAAILESARDRRGG